MRRRMAADQNCMTEAMEDYQALTSTSSALEIIETLQNLEDSIKILTKLKYLAR